jgi:hypothetical protein
MVKKINNQCPGFGLLAYICGLVSGSTGWTVTVADTSTCPHEPPELEMRFSFPSCLRRPGASQSDSGLGEDNTNGDKSKIQQQEGDNKTQHFLPPARSALQTHHWTVMVKNQGNHPQLTFSMLPWWCKG